MTVRVIQSSEAQSDAGVTSQALTLSSSVFRRLLRLGLRATKLSGEEVSLLAPLCGIKAGRISWGNYYHLENWLQWLSCSRSPTEGRTWWSDKVNNRSWALSTPAHYLDAQNRRLIDVWNGNRALSALAFNEGLPIVQPLVNDGWFFLPCSTRYVFPLTSTFLVQVMRHGLKWKVESLTKNNNKKTEVKWYHETFLAMKLGINLKRKLNVFFSFLAVCISSTCII